MSIDLALPIILALAYVAFTVLVALERICSARAGYWLFFIVTFIVLKVASDVLHSQLLLATIPFMLIVFSALSFVQFIENYTSKD